MADTTLPFFAQRFTYSDGRPLSGGKLYFFVAGSTSLPKNIYVDHSNTMPYTQPLVLDANGVAPQYYAEDGLYFIQLKDSAGALVLTRDYVQGAGGAGSADDHKVMVDAFDTPGYLVDKVISGEGVDVVNLTGTQRQLQVVSKGWVKINASDLTPSTLSTKLVSSQTAQIVTQNMGGNDWKMYIDVNAANVLDGKVKVASVDTSDYLENKLVDSATVTWDTIDVAGVKTMTANIDPGTVTGDHKTICSGTDTAPGYLQDKIVAGTGPVTVTTEQSGLDQQIHINVYGQGDVGTGGYVNTMYVANAIHTLAPNLIVRSELIVLFVPINSVQVNLTSKFGAFISQGGAGTMRYTLRDSQYRLIANSVFVTNPSPQVFLELLCTNIQDPVLGTPLANYKLVMGERYYLGINWDANGLQLLGDDAIQTNNIQPYSAYKVDNLASIPNQLTGGGENKMRPFIRLLTPEA